MNRSDYRETMAARILESMVQLAEGRRAHPNTNGRAIFERIQDTMPEAHREQFNADMANCTTVETYFPFVLDDNVVGTNYIPTYAMCLASLLAANIETYTPYSTPISMIMEVEPNGVGRATITWAVSLKDQPKEDADVAENN